MFLEYFVWGAWYVTLGSYILNAFQGDANQIGSAYANLSIAAIISPLFVGLIADRFFSPKYVMSILHLLGAICLFILSLTQDYDSFWWLILLYCLLYMPTMALSNSIAFRLLDQPAVEFPKVRAFGTLGWICSGLIISYFKLEVSPTTFKIAAFCSLALAGFSLLIPLKKTISSTSNWKQLIGFDAFVLFKKRSFIIFFITSIAICIPLSFYYSFTNPFLIDVGVENSAAVMTLGQISELLFMLAIPFAFRKLGLKMMFIIGLISWVLRYFLFAYGYKMDSHILLYIGIIIHGLCYDFFFVTGQIYMDKVADERIKSAAQGLITCGTYGIGMFLGSHVSGLITLNFVNSIDDTFRYNWQSVWMVPMLFALIILILFSLIFKLKHLPIPRKESETNVDSKPLTD